MQYWTRAHLRHFLHIFRYGRHPAITVYESLGKEVFGAFAPGWLNLGLWRGPGDETEAAVAPRRLVRAVCSELARGGCVIDVGNGLGAQDEEIQALLQPRQLIAVNISHYQLREGRDALARAAAIPVVADAVRLPFATGSADTIVSVEAAFHFRSRSSFFTEARRVLRAGGAISFSDIVVQRPPRGVLEILAGLFTIRFWGLRRSAIATATDVVGELERAGFTAVHVERSGNSVIDPAVRVIGERFRSSTTLPRLQRWAARMMVAQWRFLRRRGLPDYILVRAIAA